MFWHFCDILVSCLLSLVSLGTYLKGKRFTVKHVGWFILGSYFITGEIECLKKHQTWNGLDSQGW